MKKLSVPGRQRSFQLVEPLASVPLSGLYKLCRAERLSSCDAVRPTLGRHAFNHPSKNLQNGAPALRRVERIGITDRLRSYRQICDPRAPIQHFPPKTVRCPNGQNSNGNGISSRTVFPCSTSAFLRLARHRAACCTNRVVRSWRRIQVRASTEPCAG